MSIGGSEGHNGRVSDHLGADDVVADRSLEWPGLIWRGFRKRCPRCGGGDLYRRWFHMRDRCPTCGYLFEREPGFFIGSYFVNFVITEGFLAVIMVAFVFWKAGHPDAGVKWVVPLAVVVALVAPLVFYPNSRTIWSAIDLAMRPIELDEIVAALDAVDPDQAEDPDRVDDRGRADHPGRVDDPGDGPSLGDDPLH